METQKNILKAITGESLARNKYTFFAQKARQEGYEWIAQVFEETADNERAHAQREFEFIKGNVEMENRYNIHSIGTTLENLRAAAAGEKYEWNEMYPGFENIARNEGQGKIAKMFKEIAEVEEKHEERYNILTKLLKEKKIFRSEKVIEWKCLNCGYIHRGTSTPKNCPACNKPQAYYMQLGVVR